MDRVVDKLIWTSRHVPPDQLLDGVKAAGSLLGATDVDIHVNDYEHRLLTSMSDGSVSPAEGSVLGRCFANADELVLADADSDGVRLLMPLIDGAERLGVLELRLPALDETLRRHCGRFTALVAELLVTRGQYTDHQARLRRGEPMSLEAEMAWHLLVPLTFSIAELALSAMIEPAYDVGGDAFDYAHNDTTLHVALFDAMGHGVQAALTSTLAVGAYRHARRRQRTLTETYLDVDAAVAEHRPEAFCTAVLAELECATGELRWVNAGHPVPMLLRDLTVSRLDCTANVPVGVAAHFPDSGRPVACATALQPGDRVLFYSDGCVEAATPTGELFGEERLGDFLVREQQAGLGLAETVRRLSHAVIDHAGGKVDDDATLALVEYRGS
jgi:serine phosphatase RsbU (regulator of sigma subunit)